MGGTNIPQSRARSRWFLFGGIVILLFLLAGFLRSWYSEYQVRQEITQLNEETKRLEAKHFELSNAVTYANSLNFVEEKARTELNLVKPGENVAVIASGRANPTRQTAGQGYPSVVQSSLPQPSPLKQWWDYFFGSTTPANQ
jgi:cell division protein FtsB